MCRSMPTQPEFRTFHSLCHGLSLEGNHVNTYVTYIGSRNILQLCSKYILSQKSFKFGPQS